MDEMTGDYMQVSSKRLLYWQECPQYVIDPIAPAPKPTMFKEHLLPFEELIFLTTKTCDEDDEAAAAADAISEHSQVWSATIVWTYLHPFNTQVE